MGKGLSPKRCLEALASEKSYLMTRRLFNPASESDDRFLKGIQIFYGKLCAARQKFVRIIQNDDVVRCK